MRVQEEVLKEAILSGITMGRQVAPKSFALRLIKNPSLFVHSLNWFPSLVELSCARGGQSYFTGLGGGHVQRGCGLTGSTEYCGAL
jgi:hypothetical protein